MSSPKQIGDYFSRRFPFFHHFFKHLLSRTRVNSKKLIVNQLQSQEKSRTNDRFGINKQPSGFILQRLTATKQS